MVIAPPPATASDAQRIAGGTFSPEGRQRQLSCVLKVKAIKAGSGSLTSDRVSVAEGLNAIKDDKGMAATTSFNPDGTATRPQLRAVVRGGHFVIVSAGS